MPENDAPPGPAQDATQTPGHGGGPNSALTAALAKLQELYPHEPAPAVSSVAQSIAEACRKVGMSDAVRAISSQETERHPAGAHVALVDSNDPTRRVILPTSGGLSGMQEAIGKITERLHDVGQTLARATEQAAEHAQEAAAKNIRQ